MKDLGMLLKWSPTGSSGSMVLVPLQKQNGTQGISGGNTTVDSGTSSNTTLNQVKLYNYSWTVPYTMVGRHWASLTRCLITFGRVSSVSMCLKRSSSFGGRLAITWSKLGNGQVNVAVSLIVFPLCSSPSQTLRHYLWDCPQAQRAWDRVTCSLLHVKWKDQHRGALWIGSITG